MIEKNCSNCVKWFECDKRHSMYDSKIGEYKHCDDAEIDESLEGRMAKCPDCGRYTPSRPSLPFFWHRPDNEYDLYYCGCYGWD